MAASEYPLYTPGLAAAKVDASLRQAIAATDRAQECAVLWFAEVARRSLFRTLGFASLELYATQGLGFSRNRYFQFARLADGLERLPRLRAAVVRGELGWTKAQQVARVATPASETRWIATASEVGRRELEVRVRRARAAARRRRDASAAPSLAFASGEADTDSTPAPAGAPAVADPPTTITLRLDGPQRARFEGLVERVRKLRLVPSDATREDILLAGLATLVEGSGGADDDTDDATGTDAVGSAAVVDAQSSAAEPELRRRKSRKPLSNIQIIVRRCPDCGRSAAITSAGEKVLSPAQAEALACDARVRAGGEPNRSSIPPSARAQVLARDGHRCTTPGCGATRFLEVHHRVPRDRGGSNAPDNLVTLCSRCHRFTHEMAPRLRTSSG